MKQLTRFGMLFGALGLLASCSSDNIDGPNNPSASGDGIYLSLQITQKPLTRTATTGTMPEETGQSFENAIKDIQILLLDETQDIVKQVISVTSDNWTITGATTGNNAGNYTAVGKVDRAAIAKLVTSEEATFRVFVVCNTYEGLSIPAAEENAWTNPPKVALSGTSDAELFTSITDLADVQFASFLMTNADRSELTEGPNKGKPVYPTVTFVKADIEGNRYTDISDPLRLPVIQVQRNVARFDYAYDETTTTKYTKFRYPITAEKDEDADVIITLEDMALVNVAREFNLFKQVGAGTASATPSDWYYFKPEYYEDATDNDYRFVFNPKYIDMRSIVATERSGNPATYFVYPYFGADYTVKNLTKSSNNFNYSSISEIYETNYTGTGVTKDNPTGTIPDLVTRGYKFWCYATPNTIHETANQKKGISTGVVFRAKLTAGKDGSALANAIAANAESVVNQTIYAYGNTIYGTFADLKAYVENKDNKEYSDFVIISSTYGAAKEKLTTGQEEIEANMHDNLVANGYKVYRWEGDPGTGGFYCYYTYWNRHNDNQVDGTMGTMEFGVVRNNIYKLAVTSISKLGHPGTPGDDPDPDDPGDNDEDKEMYMQVECQVIPWTVRQNDISF